MILLLALGAGALVCVLWGASILAHSISTAFSRPKSSRCMRRRSSQALQSLAGAQFLFAQSGGSRAHRLALLLSALTVSALFATNHPLAFRALTISVSSAVIFWSARTAASAGFAPALTKVLALVVVVGALTALAQAYGIKMESWPALNRAPGGTFGNRNFMAHLTAAGLPLGVLWCIASARGKRGDNSSRDRRAGRVRGGACPLAHARGVACGRDQRSARRNRRADRISAARRAGRPAQDDDRTRSGRRGRSVCDRSSELARLEKREPVSRFGQRRSSITSRAAVGDASRSMRIRRRWRSRIRYSESVPEIGR